MWVVNGFQLAITATLLFFAALGDARGAKRTYLSGLAVYIVATVGCALAPTFGFLVAMRVLQGLSGSAVIVNTNALTRSLFPREMLGRSVANNAMFVAVGSAAGPTVGGLILSFAHWQWLFTMTIPLALLSLGLGLRYLPDLPGSGAKIDYLSGVQAAVGLGSIIYAVDGFARHMPTGEALGIAGLGIVMMVLFVRRQTGLTHPLMAVELFRAPIFTVAIVAAAATYAAQGLAYVTLPFYFQSVLGHTPLVSGLMLSAWPVLALLVATRMGPLSDRYSASFLCTVGIAVMGLGIGLYALLPAVPMMWMIVACAGIAGAGFGMFQTPNNRAILASAPPGHMSRTSGIVSVARLTGQTSGAAMVALIFELAGGIGGAHGVPARSVIQIALLTACGFMALAALMSVIRWGNSRTTVAQGA